MEIVPLSPKDENRILQCAALLAQAFSHCYGGEHAMEEMAECLDAERVALAAVEANAVLGFVGAIPQYGQTGWELHPLVVDRAYRKRGVGRALCAELENRLRQRGCLTVYLGSDDEFNQTSLSQGNLFEDTFQKIADIHNLKGHPYEFYQKLGYQIVGVIPDAGGIGKPDIWMAKSLVR